MAFVIQDIATHKYLKHDGTNNDHPYYDVDTSEAAEQYKTFKHAEFVAFWYADMHRNWRIIDTETGEKFIKINTSKFLRDTKFRPEATFNVDV